jgi:hypothetical protein
MTRPGTTPLILVGLAILGLAGLVGWIWNPLHAYAGVVAVLLCIPPAFVTVWGTGWLTTRTKYAGLVGMTVGMAIRTVSALGGGVAAFWAVTPFREMKYGFWAWVLGTYLATLVAETVVLARYFWGPTKGDAA